MTTTDEYNGWINRETWAFMLHVSNDQDLQQDALATAADAMTQGWSDHGIGEKVVEFFTDLIAEFPSEYGTTLPEGLAMFRDEVGSWRRVDRAELGKHFREAVNELEES